MTQLHIASIISAIVVLTAHAADREALRLPPAANKLRQSYTQAIEAANKPLRVRYLAELQKLQAELTKAGKLDDALAIKQEIENVEGEVASNAVMHFIGRWDAPGGAMEISTNQTARHGGDTATWEVHSGDLVLTWNNGYKHRYPLSQVGDTIQGKEIPPQGRSNTITLKRIQ